MGVCLYEMLSGKVPWPTTSQKEKIISILLAKFNFNDDVWMTISDDAKDLIKQLIIVKPGNRLTAKQALQHRWFDELYYGIEQTKSFNSPKSELKFQNVNICNY